MCRLLATEDATPPTTSFFAEAPVIGRCCALRLAHCNDGELAVLAELDDAFGREKLLQMLDRHNIEIDCQELGIQ